MKKIISFVDGSIYTQSVCDHAAWAATRTGASIDVVHVLGRRDISSTPVDLSGTLEAETQATLLKELADLDAQRARLSQQRGRVVVDDAKARLLADGVADVTAKLRNGDVVEAVHELEADADLVVVGKRGSAADFARLHLGSNLERVVRVARKPVLVASRAFQPIGRFLIAFDGGPSVMRAIGHIAAGPLFKGLECRMLMVGHDTPEARSKLEAAAALLRDAGYAVEADLRPGEPEGIISANVESGGINLLVMGAYGHSRIRNLIIGSTTSEMVRLCKVPVMLFR
ncbi:MAG: universal stress protein [Devosia sp.]|nr:universal stress protein [Devosia sp.]